MFQHRIIEATLNDIDTPFEKLTPGQLFDIGNHGLDVLGNKAGQCKKLQIIIEFIKPILPDIPELINPWTPPIPETRSELPWINTNVLIAIAMGGGLIALRDEFSTINPKSVSKIKYETISKVFQRGVEKGVKLALADLNSNIKTTRKYLK